MAPGLEISLRKVEDTVNNMPSLLSKEPSINIGILSSAPTTPTEDDFQSYNTLILNPAFITQDFDLLRFEAAAFNQIPKTTFTSNTAPISTSPAYSTSLISSPYNNPGHYLGLTTLPVPSLLFAKALTALKPTTPDYATTPYIEALNFGTVLDILRDLITHQGPGFTWPETSFYVVTFRSQLKEGIDNDYLYKLDFESHREACESGGLLKYWFGKTDAERRNLATCFWHSRQDAYKGGLGPWHKKARMAGRDLYERIVFSTYRFTVENGAKGWGLEECVE